jgi:TPR repeat protein
VSGRTEHERRRPTRRERRSDGRAGALRFWGGNRAKAAVSGTVVIELVGSLPRMGLHAANTPGWLGRLVRAPLYRVLGLAVAAILVGAIGVARDAPSFWVNVLAWASTALVTIAAGSVVIPWYQDRRMAHERELALTIQHGLLEALANHLAEELEERYLLDHPILYPVAPVGPTCVPDFEHYHSQHLVVDTVPDRAVERLIRQAKRGQRRFASYDALHHEETEPSAYWLTEAVVHLSRCPAPRSFPLLTSLDSGRLDRLRELAFHGEPVRGAGEPIARCLDRVALLRDRALSIDRSGRAWLLAEFEPWLEESTGAPLPPEFHEWMTEIMAISELAEEFARLVLLVGQEVGIEDDASRLIDLEPSQIRVGPVVFQAAAGQPFEESDIEGYVKLGALSERRFLPTYDDLKSAFFRAKVAFANEDYVMARVWAQRALDAGDTRALLLLGHLSRRVGDHAQATSWMLQAHANGDADAAYWVGLRRVEEGLEEEALKWFRQAADRNPASDACLTAGELALRRGEHVDAWRWWKGGAEAGNIDCAMALAAQAQIRSDLVTSRAYYRMAASQGSVEAIERLIEILKISTDEEAAASEAEFWRFVVGELKENPLAEGEIIRVAPPGRVAEKGSFARGFMDPNYRSAAGMDQVMARVLRLAADGPTSPGPEEDPPVDPAAGLS